MDDIEKQQQQQQTTKKPTPEVENVRLTKIMKKYKYLKQWTNRYLLTILIISVAAIIIGGGVLYLSNDTNPYGTNHTNKKNVDNKSKTNETNSFSGKVLASVTGLLTNGTLFSTLLSVIKNKLSKDKDDVFFVVKKFESPNKIYNDVFFDENNENELKENKKRNNNVFFVENNDNDVNEFDMKEIEKRNKKLRSVRNKYLVISIVGALLLIIYTIILLKAIFYESENIEDWLPDDCLKFTDCFEFMKSQNLTIGNFEIVCNITTTTEVTNKLTICQNEIFGCNGAKSINLLEENNTNLVNSYFGECYGYASYTDYGSREFALIIMLVGFCGVIHYLCIIPIFYSPRGLKLGLISVFIPIILFNLFIVGLVPGCCCLKVDDYDEIQCCINIRVSRIVFTIDEEDCLKDLKRKRKGDIEIKKKNEP
ncbi:hypothetical protein C1645_878032 [Glomus cerebriforme]|uniref:Uncharacterized protein n=1 Tax=Glomus cerebriforme TaxID=658196 RepID=A0A397SXG9_9GLOM|nr:hypothetical protein C1645_878032 [Glomus cerebriforme]